MEAVAKITDLKLLARVRKMIREEHAGFIEGNRCVEPGCSCWADTPDDRDPISGPFRNPPVRCTSFEKNVLPLDAELQTEYWAHLDLGASLGVRRCAWVSSSSRKCQKEVRGRGRVYCEYHAETVRKASYRKYNAERRNHKVPDMASAGA